MAKKAMKVAMAKKAAKTVIKVKSKKAYEKLDSKALAKVGKKSMSLADKVQLLMDKDSVILVYWSVS